LFISLSSVSFNLKEAGKPHYVLWQNLKPRTGLACRSRTRAPQRPARQVFDNVHSTPRHIHDRVLAIRNTLNSRFPSLLEHVHANNYAGNRDESDGEQRKRRQKLANEVELERKYDPQKPPHPFPLAVFGVYRSSVFDPHLL
jgi:hypothetical protein